MMIHIIIISQLFQNGFTPLHLAVVRNAYFTDDIIEILLTKGANVNARSQTKSDTPLHLAVQYANMPQVESTVMCLLENGGDPQLRNKVIIFFSTQHITLEICSIH